MHQDDLKPGAKVRTVKPARESTDWQPEAHQFRRWDVVGEVVDRSDAHGLCYGVRHKDTGQIGWYERRELQQLDVPVYTTAEREEMCAKMEAAANVFYSSATRCGVHSFIEFTGLMNEFIKVCREANKKGIDFVHSNTHSGVILPFEPWNLAYLAEKLNCIYGPALINDERARKAFIETLLGGEYRLEPVSPATHE